MHPWTHPTSCEAQAVLLRCVRVCRSTRVPSGMRMMTSTMKVKCASYRHRFVNASVEMLRRHHLVKIHPPKWARRCVVLEASRLVCVVLRTVRPSSGNMSCHRCVRCIPASGLCYASLILIRSSRQWAHTVFFFRHQSRNPSTFCLFLFCLPLHRSLVFPPSHNPSCCCTTPRTWLLV